MSKTTTPGPHKQAPKKSPKKNSTNPEVDEATAQQQIEDVFKLLTPLADFHKAVEDASHNDLRLSWDVRLIRGENTPLCHVHGTSSLPAMLAPKMLALAPTQMQGEVMEKIASPLVAIMQTEAEDVVYANLAKQESAGGYSSEEECYPQEGSDDPSAPEQTPTPG